MCLELTGFIEQCGQLSKSSSRRKHKTKLMFCRRSKVKQWFNPELENAISLNNLATEYGGTLTISDLVREIPIAPEKDEVENQ